MSSLNDVGPKLPVALTGTTYGLAHVSGKKQMFDGTDDSQPYVHGDDDVISPSPGGVTSQTIAVPALQTFASVGRHWLHSLRVELQRKPQVVFASPQVAPTPVQVTRFEPLEQNCVEPMHGCAQMSFTSSQESVLQASVSEQLRAPPLMQMPDWQLSLIVQYWPSSQPVPFATAGFVHVSVLSLQVSLVQTLPSAQVFGTPAPHAPAEQVVPTTQKRPSSQAEPLSGTGSETQLSAVSLHESAVHGFESLQSRDGPPQTPPVQVSGVVQ
jgi:hypothetical protein